MIFQNLKKFIYLIDRQTTGNPYEAAEKIEVSERTIHNYCHIIRNELGAPLIYDKYRGTYLFNGNGELVWEWLEGDNMVTDKQSFKHKRLNCLSELLKWSIAEKTGNVKTIAKKLNISERNVHYYIEILRLEFNVPLVFDRKINSYSIKTTGCLCFRWREY
jgi:DNA-binding CsgD family transcriptional regulator